MAKRGDTIELRVALDQKDLVDQITRAFEESPQALAKIARAMDPLSVAWDGINKRTNNWNEQLEASLSLLSQASSISREIQYGRVSRGSQVFQQTAAAASTQGVPAGRAIAELVAAENTIRQRMQGLGQSQVAEATKLAAQLGLVQEALKGANVEMVQQERLLQQMRTRASQYIAIMKGQTNLSPESYERLLALEKDLVNVAENHADSLEQQAAYSRILYQTTQALTAEERRANKESLAGYEEEKRMISEIIILSKQKGEIGSLAADTLVNVQRELQRELGAAETTERRRVQLGEQLIRVNSQVEKSEAQVTREIGRAVRESEKLNKEQERAARSAQAAALRAERNEVAGNIGISRSGTRDQKEEAVVRLVALQKQYNEELQDTQTSLDRVVQISRLLGSIQTRFNQLEKKSDKKNAVNVVLDTIQRERQNVERLNKILGLKLQTEEINSLQAYKEIEDTFKRQVASLGDLIEGTKEYDAALDAVARTNQVLRSTDAKWAESRLSGEAEEIRLMRLHMVLQRSAGEQGAASEIHLRKLTEQYNEEINRGNVSLERRVTLQKRIEEIEAARPTTGSGRRSQARQRGRQGGADTYGALIDLGRIFQDAPYGLVGIANNIGPFIEQLGRMQEQFRQNTGRAATFRDIVRLLGKDMLGTTIGFVALTNLLTSLIIIIPKLIDFVKKLSSGIGEVSRVTKEMNQELREAQSSESGAFAESAGLENSIQLTREFRDELLSTANEYDALQRAWGDDDALFGITNQKIKNFFTAIGNIFPDMRAETVQTGKDVQNLQRDWESNSEAVIALQATIQNSFRAIRNGSIDPLRRSVEEALEGVQQQMLQNNLDMQTSDAGRMEARRKLFELETEIQRRELRKQITDALAALSIMTSEFVMARYNRTLNPQQAAQFQADLDLQRQLIDQLLDQWNGYDDTRSDIWSASIHDEIESQQQQYRQAVRTIQDLNMAYRQGFQKLNTEGIVERINLLELEAEVQKESLRRQLEDFSTTYKDIAGFGRLRVEMERETNAQILQIDQQLAEDRQVLENEEAVRYARFVQGIVDIRREAAETVRDAELLDERDPEQRGLRQAELEFYDQQEARIRRIADLRLEAFNELEEEKRFEINETISALQTELGAQRDAHEIRMFYMRQEIGARMEQRAIEWENARQMEAFDYDSTRTEFLDNEYQREQELIEIRRRREQYELEMWLNEQRRLLGSMQNHENYFEMLGNLHVEWAQRSKQIDAKAVQAQNENLEAQMKLAAKLFMTAFGNVNSAADMFYQNWESARRNELQATGASEEEISETIQKEGAKRLAMKRTLAKLMIVANTAQMAVESYKSAMELPGLPLWVKLPLAIASAGAAILYGKAQYDAVDRESIAGGGGGARSISITAGQEFAPGVQGNGNGLSGPDAGLPGRGTTVIVTAPAGGNDVSTEVAGLREDVREMGRIIAERPVYVTPETSAVILQDGAGYIEEVSR